MTPQRDEWAIYWEDGIHPVRCRIIQRGAYHSKIEYFYQGVKYDGVYVENEDIIFDEDWDNE